MGVHHVGPGGDLVQPTWEMDEEAEDTQFLQRDLEAKRMSHVGEYGNGVTFVLVLDRVPDVGELAIFKDEEVVFLGQRLQLLAEGRGVVLWADARRAFDFSRVPHSVALVKYEPAARPTCRMSTWVFSTQMAGPRVSASRRSSSLLVTSADTQRFDCFSSMAVSSRDAIGWTSADERGRG